MRIANSVAAKTLTTLTTSEREVLEAVCEYLPEALLILDNQWQFVYLNRRAERLLCCNRQELLEKEIWQIFPELAASVFAQECQRAIAHQTEVHFEQFYEPFGIFLEIHAHPCHLGLCIYLRDVTVRKRSETRALEQIRLSALSMAISTTLGQRGAVTEVLQRCATAIVQTLEEVVLVRIWTLSQERHLLEQRAIVQTIPDNSDLPKCISLGISIVGLIAQNHQPYLTNDLAHDLCIGAKDWVQREQLVAFAGYPMIVEDRLIGVIALFSQQPLTEGTHTLLQCTANNLAIAIDRVFAREELLSRREALLFQLANHIRNSLDLDKILQAAVQEVHRLLQIDRCHFLWGWSSANPSNPQNALQLTLCITHEAKHPDLTSLLGACSPSQVTALTNALLNLHPIRVEDVTQEDLLEPEISRLMADWQVNSQLVIPLETRSGHLGAIVCGHCQAGRTWSDSEVELVQAVTDQLVIAIDQAELFAQTRAAALAAQTQAQQLSEALKNLRQTQAQLIQSEKMSSLGQLVAGIAHEINNPVTFVSGNLTHASRYFKDLLRLLQLYQQYYPEPAEEVAEVIDEIEVDFLVEDLSQLLNSMQIGTERISKIVLSLRNFSRLDEAEVKSVDLHEGIDSTLLILQHRIKPHGHSSGIEIVKQYGSLPRVNCYASQLNQVFMNILNNAIDALVEQPAPRQIIITTELKQERSDRPEAETAWVVVRIRDNGTGMPEEIRSRIFDPFFTTKPVGNGTGLGLSISHQIVVERHQGNLSCTSAPSEGTEFVIEIPAKLAHPKAPALTAAGSNTP